MQLNEMRNMCEQMVQTMGMPAAQSVPAQPPSHPGNGQRPSFHCADDACFHDI